MPLHGTVFSMEFNKSSMLSKSKTSRTEARGGVASGDQAGCTAAEEGGEGTLSQEGPGRKTSID